jgi:hypothetical protein
MGKEQVEGSGEKVAETMMMMIQRHHNRIKFEATSETS